MKSNKSTIIHLNGKVVDKATLKARRDATLYDVQTIEHKYYNAPLNDAEKAERHNDAINAMGYFKKVKVLWEDEEKFH